MGRRSRSRNAAAAGARNAGARIPSRTLEREDLERRWGPRLTREPALAMMVTAESAAHEPYHRWFRYKQGFSPALVRLFLEESASVLKLNSRRPVLDPYSGSGTCLVECARNDTAAVGIEAQEALVFLTHVKYESSCPPLPDLANLETWQHIAPRLEIPIHRAALMLAVARRHTTDGALNRNAMPLKEALDEVLRLIADDLRRPLPRRNPVQRGDARDLAMLEDESIAAVLTSPPYLSRHNYTRIIAPYETVYRFWYPTPPLPKGEGRGEGIGECVDPASFPPAVTESCQVLNGAGWPKLARSVTDYFLDLFRMMNEQARVMRPSAVAWIVIGGARVKNVYIPSDLILAEYAESHGFRVESIRVTRNIIDAARKLGTLSGVAPRESILVLTHIGNPNGRF